MDALLPNKGVKELLVLLTLTLAQFTHSLSINKLGYPDIIAPDISTLFQANMAQYRFVRVEIALYENGGIKAKTRVELRPITVNGFLYDVVRISAPVINAKAVYYIHKPNGDAMKLDIGTPKPKHIGENVLPIVARYGKHTKPLIYQENNYDAYAIKFENELKKVEENEFMIGPLSAEDHGNWVLSMYTKDFNDNWIEMFQVITVMILEFVTLTVSKVSPNQNVSVSVSDSEKRTLDLGDTLNVNIAYPIPELESCELVAPRSTFDRFFDRNRIDMATCGFSLPNITVEDAGTWKIVAIGKIMYEGDFKLNKIVVKKTNRLELA